MSARVVHNCHASGCHACEAAGFRAGQESMRERVVKACEQIDDEAVTWIAAHPDDLGDAFKHTDGVSDGADACLTAIRALAIVGADKG